MIANELRIGNKIQDRNGFIFNVIGIGEDWITTDFESNEGDVWEFNFKTNPPKPIELTEEILLKCGFKRFPWGLVINELLFKDDLKCSFLELEIGNGFRVKVNFLHQLQNLYYYLVGKELEIEL